MFLIVENYIKEDYFYMQLAQIRKIVNVRQLLSGNIE